MPSSYVYLIDASYLKQFTVLSNNISDVIVNQSIERVQIQTIQPILGKPLYDRIIQSIAQNGNYASLPSRYIDLIENYIQPCLQEYALANLIPFMAYSFNGKGIATRTDQYQQSASLEEVQYLKQEVLSSARFYAKRLNAYLCEYKGEIPEYKESSYDLEANPSTAKSFTTVYLPSRRKKSTVVPLYKNSPDNELNNPTIL